MLPQERNLARHLPWNSIAAVFALLAMSALAIASLGPGRIRMKLRAA